MTPLRFLLTLARIAVLAVIVGGIGYVVLASARIDFHALTNALGGSK